MIKSITMNRFLPFSRLVLGLALCSGGAAEAADLSLKDGEILRLPATQREWIYEHLQLGAGSLLMIPASSGRLQVDELHMATGSQLNIAPDAIDFRIDVRRAQLESGSRILGQGARGEVGAVGGAGIDLTLRMETVSLDSLDIDLSGGQGGAGWNGLPGDSGRQAGCIDWRSSRAGGAGGDGHPGADGGRAGNLQLQIPAAVELEKIHVDLDGGPGGDGGQGGSAGLSGADKSCWLYRRKGSAPAAEGKPGPEGNPGPAGQMAVKRL